MGNQCLKRFNLQPAFEAVSGGDVLLDSVPFRGPTLHSIYSQKVPVQVSRPECARCKSRSTPGQHFIWGKTLVCRYCYPLFPTNGAHPKGMHSTCDEHCQVRKGLMPPNPVIIPHQMIFH